VQAVSCIRPFPSFITHGCCHSGTQTTVETLIPIQLQIQEKIPSKNMKHPVGAIGPISVHIIASNDCRSHLKLSDLRLLASTHLVIQFCPSPARVLPEVSGWRCELPFAEVAPFRGPGRRRSRGSIHSDRDGKGCPLCFLSPILVPPKHGRPFHPSYAISGRPLGRSSSP